ncbi:MAG: 1-deoxy-D-xylulose-5-phosphate reductoisomerase [Phycisphaerales bacterium]|nr:1-deoxy-D-xylulose-5-phosphate reductoisomerase [Phycisphaerales bacterium]
MATRRLIILGSTGSIGTQALEVVTHLNALHERGGFSHRFEVVGLAAGKGAALLGQQAQRFGVRDLAIAEPNGVSLGDGRVRVGSDAAEKLVREVECDLVLAAIVGSAGLPATLAAVELGRDVALANKETLVAAGSLVVPTSHRTGAKLLPVDSEHAAVWQCLQGVSTEAPALRSAPRGVRRVILTASGGPFRTASRDEIAGATREQALKHPTWTMGAKVTIDSASLMNKALEIIEAHWLFALPGEKIEAAVHPQSAAHAVVEFDDASMVAQLATPDMRGPIQSAFTCPNRVASLVTPLAMGSGDGVRAARSQSLQFEAPDGSRFPLLHTAYRVIREGGTSGAIVNAANEEAVLAFLREDSMKFGRIAELVLEAIESVAVTRLTCLGDALEADRRAREWVRSRLARRIG